MNERISACATGDNCCPTGCNATNDAECGAVCDNGTLEPGETWQGAWGIRPVFSSGQRAEHGSPEAAQG